MIIEIPVVTTGRAKIASARSFRDVAISRLLAVTIPEITKEEAPVVGQFTGLIAIAPWHRYRGSRDDLAGFYTEFRHFRERLWRPLTEGDLFEYYHRPNSSYFQRLVNSTRLDLQTRERWALPEHLATVAEYDQWAKLRNGNADTAWGESSYYSGPRVARWLFGGGELPVPPIDEVQLRQNSTEVDYDFTEAARVSRHRAQHELVAIDGEIWRCTDPPVLCPVNVIGQVPNTAQRVWTLPTDPLRDGSLDNYDDAIGAINGNVRWERGFAPSEVISVKGIHDRLEALKEQIFGNALTSLDSLNFASDTEIRRRYPLQYQTRRDFRWIEVLNELRERKPELVEGKEDLIDAIQDLITRPREMSWEEVESRFGRFASRSFGNNDIIPAAVALDRLVKAVVAITGRGISKANAMTAFEWTKARMMSEMDMEEVPPLFRTAAPEGHRRNLASAGIRLCKRYRDELENIDPAGCARLEPIEELLDRFAHDDPNIEASRLKQALKGKREQPALTT